MTLLKLQRTLAVVTAALLGAAALGLFVATQRLKAERPPITAVRFSRPGPFSPGCSAPCKSTQPFSFALTRSQHTTVRVLAAGGAPVRTLLDRRVRHGVVRLVWDGRDAAGRVARDGSYTIEVRLHGDGRAITFPYVLRVDTTPPSVTLSGPAYGVVGPGLSGKAGAFTLHAVSSEPAQLRLRVYSVLPDGTVKPAYTRRRPGISTSALLVWHGDRGLRFAHEHGAPADPGTYFVGVQATDLAGNRTYIPASFSPGSTGPARIARVRTVDLTPLLVPLTPAARVTLVRYRPGLRLTDQPSAPAIGAPATTRAPAATTPGLYAVRASARLGHRRYSAWAPLAVPGSARMLVVVPTLSWQLHNSYDADNNGFPDVPPQPLALDRPLPHRIRKSIAALARAVHELDRSAAALGAIDDLALNRAAVPRSARVLVLDGVDAFTPLMIRHLRAFRARGGSILDLGGNLLTGTRVLSAGLVLAPDVSASAARASVLRGALHTPAAALRAAKRGGG